jgi:hypothetical protein
VFIEAFLNTYCVRYKGCYSANNLPTSLLRENRFSLVCNLAKTKEVGTHFVCIVCEDEYILYVDSYGLPCWTDSIFQFMQGFNKPILHNARQIQSYSSRYCAFYSILYCMYFEVTWRNVSFKLVFNNGNLNLNDSLCITQINKLRRLYNLFLFTQVM